LANLLYPQEQWNIGTKWTFSLDFKGLGVPLFLRNGTRRESAYYK